MILWQYKQIIKINTLSAEAPGVQNWQELVDAGLAGWELCSETEKFWTLKREFNSDNNR